jgi:hypothetical protein
LYDAPREAGVSDERARAAAAAVLGTDTEAGFATKGDIAFVRSDIERCATKADLQLVRADVERCATKVDFSDLRAELIKWNVGTIIAMTAVFAAIVKLL